MMREAGDGIVVKSNNNEEIRLHKSRNKDNDRLLEFETTPGRPKNASTEM